MKNRWTKPICLVTLAMIWLAIGVAGYQGMLVSTREHRILDPTWVSPSQFEEAVEALFLGLICTLFATPFVVLFVVRIVRDRSIGWLVGFAALISLPLSIVNELAVNLRIHFLEGRVLPAEALIWMLAGVGIVGVAYLIWYCLYLCCLEHRGTRARILGTAAVWLVFNILGEVGFAGLPKHDLYEAVSNTGTIYESTPFSHTTYPAVETSGGGDYAALLVANSYQAAILVLPLVILAVPRWKGLVRELFGVRPELRSSEIGQPSR